MKVVIWNSRGRIVGDTIRETSILKSIENLKNLSSDIDIKLIIVDNGSKKEDLNQIKEQL